MKRTNKKVRVSKASASAPAIDKGEIDKILGECHDGEDVKVLLKDGTVKIVPKSDAE